MRYFFDVEAPISERYFRHIVASAFAACAIMEFVGYFYYYQLWPVYFKVLDMLSITIACLYAFFMSLLLSSTQLR